MTTMYLTMSTRIDSDSLPNSIPAKSSSHFKCHCAFSSGKLNSIKSSRLCTSLLSKYDTYAFFSPYLLPRFSRRCFMSGLPRIHSLNFSLIAPISGRSLMFWKIRTSSLPASIHSNYFICQIWLQSKSSRSWRFPTSFFPKCSSACLRNFKKTMLGKLFGCEQTQST